MELVLVYVCALPFVVWIVGGHLRSRDEGNSTSAWTYDNTNDEDNS